MDKKTILVIEDNEKHRFLMEDLLDDEGYRVETAKDGGEAIKKMEGGGPFDLLMVDIAVPGFDAVQFIKAHKDKHKILVVSAFVESVKDLLLDHQLIKKPFDTGILLDRVKEILSS